MTDYPLLHRLREQYVAFPDAGNRVLALMGVLVIAETSIFLRFIQLGLLLHVATMFTLFWLAFITDEPARAYGALVFVPLLRLLNFGTAVASEQAFIWIAGIYLLVLFGLALLLRDYDFGLREMGVYKIDSRWDWLLIITGVVIGIALGGVQWVLDLETPLAEPTLQSVLLIALVTGVLVGCVEEVLFRGLLQPWVAEITSTNVSIGMVSILFGFMHSVWLNPLDIVFAFVVSVLLGVVYARSRNFWFTVGVHSFINITAFAILPILVAT